MNIEFYQHLGKLFYAIAKTDNCVREKELNKLEEVLDQEWSMLDDFSTRAKTILINTFKWLHSDNEYGSEVCYNSFINYKRQHEALFSSEMKSLILKTAAKIASSFNSQNKSELIMLAKLNIEFKQKTEDFSI